MAIPDFQTLMRPVLEEVLQSQPTPIPPLFDTISNKFKLSDEERSQTLNSNSTIYIIGNRIQWAVSYLYKAGLLDRPSRGVYAVSELGKQALKTHTDKINIKTLEQYPKFFEWRNKEKKQSDNGLNIEIEVDSNQTPQEIIEKGYRQLVASAKQELLDRIINSTPDFFEQVILDLLLAMGYGGSQKDASQRMGKTGDGGIDGVIKEDALGLDVVYVQAKRYKENNAVPVSHVRDFAGSLQANRANKGVFVTTSYFSKDAYDFVSKVHSRIILIDGDELSKLLYEHGIGVRMEMRFDVKKIDEGYFSD
jgi:restriction system protein